jgi:hypothetical protein
MHSRTIKKLVAVGFAAVIVGTGLTACSTDADVASQNLSTEAEQFKIERRIVFFNGITDKYLLTIEGLCSVESGDSALSGSLEVTCKVGDDKYKKHFLGLSDNVSYFVEQTNAANVSKYHYEVVFKPEVIVPDIKLSTSVTDGK